MLSIRPFAGGRIVDLNLKTLDRKICFLVSRVEVNSRIALVPRNHLHFQIEVLEVSVSHRSVIKEM